jgi:predicted Ser/Thr protein kinase
VRAVLVVLVWLAGCAAEGRPLHAWDLVVDANAAAPVAVRLPGNLFTDLPLRYTGYALHASVELADDERGRELSLVVPCFHRPLALAVDGVSVAPIGADNGEHRFVIPASATTGPQLALSLTTRLDWDPRNGFYAPPRLMIGHAPRGAPAAFHFYLNLAAIFFSAFFMLLYGTMFALDRRREYAVFAGGVLAVTIYLAYNLGYLDLLGAWAGASLFGIAVWTSTMAIHVFLHLSLDLGRPPRSWLLVSAGFCALYLIAPPWLLTLAVVNVLSFLGWVAFFLYVGLVVIRRALRGPHRDDARLLLVIGYVPHVVTSLFELGVIGVGVNPLGAVHIGALGTLAVLASQAMIVSRQFVARRRALEQTAEELRRQVAERSRELADALARLAQRPAEPVGEGRIIDGRYRVEHRIGAGGMGTVFAVRRLSDDARLALKTLRGRGDPERMARFAREAQIAAELDHPNLVPVLDVGIADEGLFLVMPRIEGGSLEQARARFGDVAWAWPLLGQIASGLAALHERGIVHRDLKPGNVLVADGTARIADFGLATLATDAGNDTQPATEAFAETAAPLTRAGDVFGTPAYMAPELAASVHEAPASSDLFAFGVLAYEMLTGRGPFTEPPGVSRAHGRPITLPPRNGLDPTLARCLDLDPDRRPSAAELADVLRGAPIPGSRFPIHS